MYYLELELDELNELNKKAVEQRDFYAVCVAEDEGDDESWTSYAKKRFALWSAILTACRNSEKVSA